MTETRHPEDALMLDNQICFRLYKASRTMTRLYQPLLEQMKITYPQYITMLVIWENEIIDFKALGQRLDLKTGTLTPIIKRLESMGFLTREKNPDDNRKIWVKITEEGMRQKENALKIPEQISRQINLDYHHYLRYTEVLNELESVLEKAEIKQKKEAVR